ncbi:MAG: alpha-L-fucosidase, partial [Thermoguttaceae bacterium]
MRQKYFIFTLGALLVAILVQFVSTGLAAESAKTALPKETSEQRDQRMDWWRNARFGMFIHWGVYSVPAGVWNDKEVKGCAEWIMEKLKIPLSEYEKFRDQFNPVKFDA